MPTLNAYRSSDKLSVTRLRRLSSVSLDGSEGAVAGSKSEVQGTVAGSKSMVKGDAVGSSSCILSSCFE